MRQYSIMTFMFKWWLKEGGMSHEQLLGGLAEAGANGVEPFHRDFVDDPTFAGTWRRIVEDCGMSVPAVDVMTNLVYADAAGRAEGQSQLKRGMEICHELGASIAHVAGHKLVGNVTPADGRKMIAEQMAEAADSDLGKNLTFAIEDFNPSPTLICAAKDCLEIVELSDGRVKIVFDTGNFIAVDEWADQVFDTLADHIVYCHFKDFVRTPGADKPYKSTELGEGEIPNEAVAKKLIARDYDGWVALETAGGRRDENPVTTIGRELPRLKSWFGDG